MTIAASLLTAVATATAITPSAIPPKAAPVTGPIEQVELGPVFAERYLCVEHALELEYAGDALGTCMIGPVIAEPTVSTPAVPQPTAAIVVAHDRVEH